MRKMKFLTVLLFLFCVTGTIAQVVAPNKGGSRTTRPLSKVPLAFEVNHGQANKHVQFLSRGAGYTILIAPQEVALNLNRQPRSPATSPASQSSKSSSIEKIQMKLLGANSGTVGEPSERKQGVVSYFIGNDPSKWQTDIPTYGRIRYADILPGIDLVFYGSQRQLEYDFVVAPGADPSNITWQIEGAQASRADDGSLDLNTSNGLVRFEKPLLYQMSGEKKTPVEGAFTVRGNRVGFHFGNFDHSRPLIIDPVLLYVSYLGGTNQDNIGFWAGPGILKNNPTNALAVDGQGAVYVTGYTQSSDFPTAGNPEEAVPPTKSYNRTGIPTVFVSKFSPDGSTLEYSTYLGGDGWDYGYAIAVDGQGSAYITGTTGSGNFPITNGAYQTVCSPTNTVPVQSGCEGNGLTSAYVTKLTPDGTGIVYSTFLSGWGNSWGQSIAVDGAGRAYVAGNANTFCAGNYAAHYCFPTTNGAVMSGNDVSTSQSSAFVSVFDPTGSQLAYSTAYTDEYMINNNVTGCPAHATGVAVDTGGYFYMTGYTQAGQIPTTPGAFQPTQGPYQTGENCLVAIRGYVAKFNPVTSANGASLAYATYFGGTSTSNVAQYISGITADAAGNAYIVGNTNQGDIPIVGNTYGTACGIPENSYCATAFVAKLDSSLSQIVWSTYLGGVSPLGGDGMPATNGIALDGAGNVYVEGEPNGSHFPYTTQVQSFRQPGVVVAELDPTGSNLLFATGLGSNAQCGGISAAGMAVDAGGKIYLAGNTNAPDLVTTSGSFQNISPKIATPCGNNSGFVGVISPLIPTSTALSVVPHTATYGQNVTFTATITAGIATSLVPTGSVTFKDALGNILGSNPVSASGVATYSTSGLSMATYAITATYTGDDNFMTSASAPQILVISGGQAQTITFGALANVTYGVSPIALTATASSGLAVSYSVTGPAAVSGSILSITGSGPVSVTASQAGNSSFAAASPVVQGFTVSQAPLTITALDVSVPYNQLIPALNGYTATGFVNGDTTAVLVGAPSETTAAVQGSSAGSYPITISQGTLTAANYSFNHFANGSLTITGGVTQTITFGPLSGVPYGAAPITLTATASSGLPVSYSVTGPAAITGSTLSIKGAGLISVTASQSGNINWAAAASVIQTFTAAPAQLTVTAANAAMTYGQSIPTLTFAITGFVNGDSVAVVSGAPAESTIATPTSAPSTYTITVAPGTLASPNYTFNFVNGALTIAQASQTISFAALPNVSYGGAPIALTATASSGLPVSFTLAGPATLSGSILTITGVGTVVVAASQTGNANYAAALPVSRSFTVAQANQTITFAPIPSQIVGTLLLTASASSGLPVGFTSLSGTVCTVSRTTANLLAPGICTIQATQGGNVNYLAAASVTQSFQVSAGSAAAFTITPYPATEVIRRGDIAKFFLELKSVNGFNGDVKLSCSSLPSGSRCVDFPQTVYLNRWAHAYSGVLFPRDTAPGTYTITFTGTSGSIVETSTAEFTVK